MRRTQLDVGDTGSQGPGGGIVLELPVEQGGDKVLSRVLLHVVQPPLKVQSLKNLGILLKARGGLHKVNSSGALPLDILHGISTQSSVIAGLTTALGK